MQSGLCSKQLSPFLCGKGIVVGASGEEESMGLAVAVRKGQGSQTASALGWAEALLKFGILSA